MITRWSYASYEVLGSILDVGRFLPLPMILFKAALAGVSRAISD